MTEINYTEFQPGQGVSAPLLNENFTLTKNELLAMEQTLNDAIRSLTSDYNLKADKAGSSSQKFYVADATENTQAVSLRQLNQSALTPVGTVIWYAGSTAPSGYLLCNGSKVSRTTYAALYAVIGIRYGSGNGTTTFTLPNLIGKFAEGASSVGTYKNAGLPNITGYARIDGTDSSSYTVNGALYNYGTFTGAGQYHHTSQTIGAIGFDASKSNSIYGNSTTVQPASLTLLPCIKY